MVPGGFQPPVTGPASSWRRALLAQADLATVRDLPLAHQISLAWPSAAAPTKLTLWANRGSEPSLWRSGGWWRNHQPEPAGFALDAASLPGDQVEHHPSAQPNRRPHRGGPAARPSPNRFLGFKYPPGKPARDPRCRSPTSAVFVALDAGSVAAPLNRQKFCYLCWLRVASTPLHPYIRPIAVTARGN